MKFKDITIVSDMDGTLLTEEKTISSGNIDAIRYFCENGRTFTLASGRIYKKMVAFSQMIHLDLPIISHNGAVIYDIKNDKVVYKAFLSGNYKDVIEEIYNDNPYIGIEAYTEHDVRYIKHNQYIDKHMKDEGFLEIHDSNGIRWYNFKELDEEWCKILMANSPKDSGFLERTIPQKYPEFQFVRGEAHYFEMLPKNVSKGIAVRELMKIIDKPLEKLYTIGDNMNDCQMLKAAKVGIAVQNASDGLKAAADVILPYTNEEHAIAKLIDMIETNRI